LSISSTCFKENKNKKEEYMDLAICIAVKNRSNLVVYQEDPIETYKHIAEKIQSTPSDTHFPPTLNRDATITLNLLPKTCDALKAKNVSKICVFIITSGLALHEWGLS
jgi:hypothetical protein